MCVYVNVYMCMCACIRCVQMGCVCQCHSVHVEDRRWLFRFDSLSPLHRFGDSNSDYRASAFSCWAILPAPSSIFFKIQLSCVYNIEIIGTRGMKGIGKCLLFMIDGLGFHQQFTLPSRISFFICKIGMRLQLLNKYATSWWTLGYAPPQVTNLNALGLGKWAREHLKQGKVGLEGTGESACPVKRVKRRQLSLALSHSFQSVISLPAKSASPDPVRMHILRFHPRPTESKLMQPRQASNLLRSHRWLWTSDPHA